MAVKIGNESTFARAHGIKILSKGPSINYVVSRGEGGGQKLPILLGKKTTKRWGGGQKSPILRQHSLWTAPKSLGAYFLKIIFW